MEKLIIAILEHKKLITAKEAEALVEELTSGILPAKYEQAVEKIKAVLK
jgi:hypothetical protein